MVGIFCYNLKYPFVSGKWKQHWLAKACSFLSLQCKPYQWIRFIPLLLGRYCYQLADTRLLKSCLRHLPFPTIFSGLKECKFFFNFICYNPYREYNLPKKSSSPFHVMIMHTHESLQTQPAWTQQASDQRVVQWGQQH